MKRAVTALIAVTSLACAGCSSDSPAVDTPTDAAQSAQELTLNVFAAASLQKSFDEIAEEFTAQYQNISVNFNYAGSSTLVQNLAAGAPADVFAPANEANMDNAEECELIVTTTRELFASNTLVGIVPVDNPADVTTLEEANAEGVNLVACAPQVPCGALSQTLAKAAGITLDAVSEEQQVSDVLGKVRSGQADAGLVYATDAALAPDEVTVFEIVGAQDELNLYPIARTAHSEQPDAADAFLEYVHSDAGQTILQANGFSAP